MCPFPAARVIHPDWAVHHRPTAHGTLTATCTITTGGGGGWDPITGPIAAEEPAATLYTGLCGVLPLARGERTGDAAGQDVTDHPYAVAINAAAGEIPKGARVRIDTCPDDTQLVGKVLTVAETSFSSVRLERDLLCDLDPANQPTPPEE